MFIGGTHPTTPPKPTMPATTTAPTLQQIDQQIKEAQKQLTALKAQKTTVKLQQDAEVKWDSFLKLELNKVFTKKESARILKDIKFCRSNGKCYLYMNSTYRRVCGRITTATIDKRRFLRVVIAADKLKNGAKGQNNSLKSKMREHSACPHCGSLAIRFIDRLKKEYINI